MAEPAPGDVPTGPEPFAEAAALQAWAAREGFDWPDATAVLPKVAEEVAELGAAATPAERAEELGDLLFVLVNWARHHGLEPATCLALANAKFRRRYAHVRRFMAEYPPAGAARLAAMDARWDDAKRLERGNLAAPPAGTGDAGPHPG